MCFQSLTETSQHALMSLVCAAVPAIRRSRCGACGAVDLLNRASGRILQQRGFTRSTLHDRPCDRHE